MRQFSVISDGAGNSYYETGLTGSALLHNPLLNKGTAFSAPERVELGLNGLLPPHVATLDEQLTRVYENFSLKPNNLEKYVHLRALQDRNETLFYALVQRHVEEMIPIIYTPTVGEAVQKLSHIYRNARGLWISPDNVDRMTEMAQHLPYQEVEVIVVTDNQGILGIGDQGAGGMGIPIGKLSLYTLGAGIAPYATLPISLDVGTDNEALLDDPLYLGHKHRRLTGDSYDNFIHRFTANVQKLYPNALLQWEDFSKQNAFTNLDKFRESSFSFNDDIQGTGAVVAAGTLAAMKLKNKSIADQTILVHGAGAGGMGVARQMRNTLMETGLSREAAAARVFVVDSRGLITTDRLGLERYKLELATDPAIAAGWDLVKPNTIGLIDVIRNAHVTVLLGLSGQPGVFTREVVLAMADNVPTPVIFPLSNPTSKAEAIPADVLEWSKGRAIVATGSPFDDVTYGERTYRIGQGNNVFIFPGVGLGALAAGAFRVTDEMFSAAANRLAALAPSDIANTHAVFPRIADLHKVSVQVAKAVYDTAMKQGLATVTPDTDPLKAIEARMWSPLYVPLRSSR